MAEQSFSSRLKHAWNVFRTKESEPFDTPRSLSNHFSYGVGSTSRLDRQRLRLSNERTVVASIFNKIAADVAAVPIKHIKNNKNGRYESTVDSGLNNCLSLEANIDQTGREFVMDLVLSMFDEGVVAAVPVESSVDIERDNAFDILQIRTGRITQWYPRHVKVEVYDDRDGNRKEVVLPKEKVAIVENPFFTIMNESNSTVKRLTEKLNLLDNVDNKAYSSKLDMIIQLPYSVKSEARQKDAEKRISNIEEQLNNSAHGIAYTDVNEHITQLNRPIDNKLVEQIQNLKKDLLNELGIPMEVFDGTADEKTQLNYQNGTIEPILSAITDEFNRKFLTKTARTRGQSIKAIQDPFRLVPIDNIAEIADKFTRNEILSANDIRAIIGIAPVDDPRADELRNKNLNVSDEQLANPLIANNE